MRYLSLFSGLEGASLAWRPLGWECVGVSEIDPFCCELIKQRFPSVPNLGDITKVTEEQIRALGRIDVVIGGFPCQDVSVAGARKGFHDDASGGTVTRSGLFYEAMRVVRLARPRWTVIENVPGLFTSRRGRDFATVVSELAGAQFDVPAGGWRSSGVAAGPDGMVEWRTLDAQFFGVAQRRARVFLVRDSGAWADRRPVLLEREGMLGDSRPRTTARTRVAARAAAGARDCGPRERFEPLFAFDLGVAPREPAAHEQPTVVRAVTSKIAKGTSGPAGDEHHHLVPVEPAPSIHNISDSVAREGKVAGSICGEAARGRGSAQQTVVVGALGASGGTDRGARRGPDEAAAGHVVVHALTADGHDASEDGTGRGTPIVPCVASTLTGGGNPNSNAPGRRKEDDANLVVSPEPAPPVFRESRRAQSSEDDETWVDGEVANTLNGFDVGERDTHAVLEPQTLMENGSDVQAGGLPHIRDGHTTGVPRVYEQEVADPISASEAKTYTHEGCTFRTRNVTATATRVRRLTVLECERLQGLPDGWTRIRARYCKKKKVTRLRPEDRWERAPDGGWFLMAADGPRYKAIGNGFAIPVIRWIGERIAAACKGTDDAS